MPRRTTTGSTAAKTSAKTPAKTTAKSKGGPAANSRARQPSAAQGKRSSPAKATGTPRKNTPRKSKADAAAAALTPASLLTAQLGQARAMMADGKTLPNHLARVVRDAWLLESADHVWPSSAEVAGDLGVSSSTVDNWRADGAPIEKASPVPKAALLRWLWEREKARGESAGDDAEAARAAVDLRIKLARAAKEERRLQQEAADHARAIIAAEVAALADLLRKRGSRALVAAILADHSQGVEQQGLEATATAVIDDLLASLRDERAGDDSHTTTTPTGQE